MGSKSRHLRPGFTSGACAAAAAKGATLLLLSRGPFTSAQAAARGPVGERRVGGSGNPVSRRLSHAFTMERAWPEEAGGAACASVIKDAGDDPDVTHGVEIVARVTSGVRREGAPPGQRSAPCRDQGR